MNNLTFNQVTIKPVPQNDGKIWIASKDLANALGYKNSKSINNLYNANADEFSRDMTTVTELMTVRETGNILMKTRIFSLRGCHLIAMLAKTAIAKDFRKWVLNILDKEVEESQPQPTQVSNHDWQRYLKSLTIPEMAKLTDKSEKQVISGIYHATHCPNERSTHLVNNLATLSDEQAQALEQFWQAVAELDMNKINHSRDPHRLAINLNQIYKMIGDKLPSKTTILKALKLSENPKFESSNYAVSSKINHNKTVKTWVFSPQNAKVTINNTNKEEG